MNGKTKNWLIILSIFVLLVILAGCAQAPQNAPQTAASQSAVRFLDLTGLSNTPTSPPVPTPFPTFTPISTATLAPTDTALASDVSTNAPTTTPVCLNKAEFVKNLAVSDGTNFHQADIFTKVWLVKNAGSCTWDSNYALIFAGGDLMDGPLEVPLPKVVPPGETVELRMTLVAPMSFNTFFSNWMLRDGLGNVFGVGENGSDPLVVKIVVPFLRVVTPP
jgi:hypothetical protein